MPPSLRTSPDVAAAPSLPAPRGWRLWLLACRLRTLPLSVVPVLVGTALAAVQERSVHWPALLATLLAAMLIQIGTNLYNDAADALRGNDGPARLGPPRVTALGWVSARRVQQAAALAFAGALLCGGYLLYRGGWPILAIGLLSLLAGWAYSGGPRPISHSPFGELFVWVFFGVLAVAGSHYLQSLRLAWPALWLGGCLGLFAAAVLTVNNTRDIDEDRCSGRRTLSIVLGRRAAARLYAFLMLLPFPLLALAAWPWPLLRPAALLACFALPRCVRLVRRFKALLAEGSKAEHGPACNELLAQTAQAQVRVGLLLCLALLYWL